MKTVLWYTTFEFMLLCFPAQFGVKWGDEKKPESKNMTHQKSIYLLDIWICQFKFNTVNSALRVCRSSGQNRISTTLWLLPFSEEIRKACLQPSSKCAADIKAASPQFSSLERDSDPVTIRLVNAGEEHYGIKQENIEGFVSHTYQTPPLVQSKPTKEFPTGECVWICTYRKKNKKMHTQIK